MSDVVEHIPVPQRHRPTLTTHTDGHHGLLLLERDVPKSEGAWVWSENPVEVER